ncbi:hypothetical protein BH11MYX2_BH11MYX2_07010 [soil metagenome]
MATAKMATVMANTRTIEWTIDEFAMRVSMLRYSCNGVAKGCGCGSTALAPDPRGPNVRLAALDEERVPLSL